MVYVQTKLEIADNSGGLKALCIKILDKKFVGSVGSLVLVSLKKINPKKKLLKGHLHKGVIVRLRKKTIRNGGYVFVDENAIVILNNTLLPLATRIFGPVLRELRIFRKFNKILSLAKFVI
jgi:large subunit ribosomal protein L14